MNIPKQIKTRSVVVLLACMLVVSSVSIYYAFSASTPTSGLTDIYVNPPMQESSYVIGIYTAPSTCYLQNGTTGEIETTGTFYTCFQGAINALSVDAGGTGGKILIRDGKYNLTLPISIASYGIYIEGESFGADVYGTIIYDDLVTPAGALIYYGLNTWHYLGGIKNIMFQGRNRANTYGIIVQGYTSDISFVDCGFLNFDIGVVLKTLSTGTSKIWNFWFDRCLFEDNTRYGIYLTSTYEPVLRNIDRVKISECHFYDNLNSIYCDAEYVYHVTFTDNTVQAERGESIKTVSGGRQWIITDNQIFDCGIGANGTMAAIMVNGTGTFYPDSWLIENNVIANHFTSAPVATNNSIWLTGTVRNFGIQGNYFYVASEPVRLSGLVMTTDPKLVIQNNVGNYTWGDVDNYDYLIGWDGYNYYSVNASSNTVMLLSTNASAVIDSCIATNSTIFFKEGVYNIDYLLPVDVSNVHFVGSGWGTQFSFNGNGGFNITSTSDLFDISFSNIFFTSVGNSLRMITSAMADNKRIAHFTFDYNRVSNFTYAGTIPLNLTNLEVSEIKYNYFYDTRTGFIQLGSVNYHMGNDWIEDNVFYLGYNAADENAIRLTTIANDGTYGTIYNIWGTNNQFFAPSTAVRALAWNLTTISGAMEGITLSGDRTERTQYVCTAGSNSYKIRKINIDKAFLATELTQAGMKMINLDQYTRSCIISKNQIQVENATSYYFMDNYTASTDYANKFTDNQLISAVGALIAPSSLTILHGNVGLVIGLHADGSVIVGTVGETVAVGNLVFRNSSGYWKTNAVSATKMPAIAMAIQASSGSCILLLQGYFTDAAWSWTTGAILYASNTTAGGMTMTYPSNSGAQVEVVGYAVSATEIYFDPNLVVITIT